MKLLDDYFTPLLPAQLVEKDSYNLIESGVLDSIGLFTLIVHLEDHLKINVDAYEISEENFKNINAIEKFVSLKLKEKMAVE